MSQLFQDPPVNNTVAPAVPQAKPSYKIHNWIALAYVALLAITFFNRIQEISGLLFWIMAGFGLVAACSFVGKMFKMGRTVQNNIAKVFIVLVALGGGAIIFIIAGVVAIIGYFANNPISFGF
jgi:hypothetical protein